MEGLELEPAHLAAYRRAFDEALSDSAIPLLDLDELEEHTGCHSRAGDSIYVDGITGQVSPCIRVPFAPAECRLDRGSSLRLPEVLSHPFFVAYRQKTGSCSTWCGADLWGEREAVGRLLGEHAARDERLTALRQRSDAARPLRRIPLLRSEPRP